MLEGTLRSVPVGDGRHAQAVISVAEPDDLCPRGVLAKQVAALGAAGQTAVVAVELEFYVTKPQPDGVVQARNAGRPLRRSRTPDDVPVR